MLQSGAYGKVFCCQRLGGTSCYVVLLCYVVRGMLNVVWDVFEMCCTFCNVALYTVHTLFYCFTIEGIWVADCSCHKFYWGHATEHTLYSGARYIWETPPVKRRKLCLFFLLLDLTIYELNKYKVHHNVPLFLVSIYYSASFILLQVCGAVDLGQIWQWQQNICQGKNRRGGRDATGLIQNGW